MSVEILNPFESYFGQDGRPIGAGSLYIGVAGLDPQLNPIDVFYDREMTVPAMQPLNVSGGYVWNCCAPTKIFTAAAGYSLKVLGKNGEQVFYCQSVDLLSEAGLISYIAPFSGASIRTQSDKNAESISVKDFGITGDGSDEATKLRSALAAIGKDQALDFCGLTVSIGSSIYLTKNNFTLKKGGIKARNGMTTASEQPVLRLTNCNDFSLQYFEIDANRAGRVAAEASVHALHLRSCKRFTMIQVKALNGVCDGLYLDSQTPTDKATHTQNGVFINCEFDNAYRNCASIIVGRNIVFNGSRFTNANGTAPQAGVNLETNDYGVDGLIENITFNDCQFVGSNGWQVQVTANDNPKNIRFNGGIVTSNRGLASGANTGGMLIANDTTVIDSVSFKDFTANSGYCVRSHSIASAMPRINNCKFINIDGGTIQSASSSMGCVVTGCKFVNAGGTFLSGANHLIQDCQFDDMTGIALYGGSAAQSIVIDKCYIDGAVGRGIFCEGAKVSVLRTTVKDVLTPTAYIQISGSGAIVDDNTCTATAVTNTPLLIANGNTAHSIQRNSMLSGSVTTDEYSISGNLQTTSAKIANNIGGAASAQKQRKTLTPQAIANCTSGTRPDPTTLPVGTQFFDTSLGRVITTNAIDWYSDGQRLQFFDIAFSQLVSLVSVPANSTASQTITMTGVSLGWAAIASYDLNLGGTRMWAEVTATDTVTIYRRNDSGSTAGALSGRLKVRAMFL